ncbi:segregation/condensation protein A [Sporanaerobium hydrogeniformans]|uniref:Segregation/condensation protein A n=1 Tax=Sporanaerobium hydrogeniformans TaxID=3072179 RepID=A0AC61DD64_9FIRM|nr:segregation/condensation protein A [Sporanaerobium hydrogeniformans]PHV71154.1 segregation/condensation protein A [Sporanaerobium hydrogeniformans]
MAITFKLQDFEGPLDLLLYLIEKNKMNIYDIEIASITDQYMAYLEDTSKVELEQLSEFIVMASTLLVIKSRMLLPKEPQLLESEEDPREELVRKLLEYKKVKYVSEQLKEHQEDSDTYCFRNQIAKMEVPEVEIPYNVLLEDVSLKGLYDTFEMLMRQKDLELQEKEERKIDYTLLKRDVYTIEQKGQYILNLITLKKKITFFEICSRQMPKIELIVTFMALLELVHKKQIQIEQNQPLGDIQITGGMCDAENGD